MATPHSLAELAAKYNDILWQVGEFLVVTAALYLPGRFVLEPLVAWVFARRDNDRTIEAALQKVVHVAVVAGALLLGATAAGFGGVLGGSALIVAALTLAVGFAAQDVISNFVAGAFIVQDPNFNIDDIGFRVTRVRTFDNETVTVPNTELATTSVTNRMSNPMLRISYAVGIGYDDDVDRATRILLETAAERKGVLEDPAPSVRVTDLADSAVVLQARFWIDDPDREEFSATRSAYVRAVKERCQAAGVDLSTTTQHDLSGDLTVHDAPAPAPE